jgi:hypothetical protein
MGWESGERGRGRRRGARGRDVPNSVYTYE